MLSIITIVLDVVQKKRVQYSIIHEKKVSNPEKYFECTLKATAKVKESLKGDLKGKIEILGGELFICAQCVYKEGHYLLFLNKKGTHLLNATA